MASRTTEFHRKLRVPMRCSMGWIPYFHINKIEEILVLKKGILFQTSDLFARANDFYMQLWERDVLRMIHDY